MALAGWVLADRALAGRVNKKITTGKLHHVHPWITRPVASKRPPPTWSSRQRCAGRPSRSTSPPGRGGGTWRTCRAVSAAACPAPPIAAPGDGSCSAARNSPPGGSTEQRHDQRATFYISEIRKLNYLNYLFLQFFGIMPKSFLA